MRIFLASLLCAARALAGPLTFGSVPGFDPAHFRVTTFATGLGFAFGLTRDHTGALLAGAGGQVLRFTDSNNDGVADGPGVPVVSGINGFITDLDRVGGYLVLSSIIGTTSQIQFYRFGGNPEDAYVLAGVLTIQFTSDWSHQSPGSALRPIPGQPDRFDLFVNVGSRTNNTASPDVTVSGLSLPSTMVPADSILRFELDLSGAAPIVSSPVQAVKGIRNSLAMGFHPQTGDFYFADNGIDGLVDINEPFSTDELNRVLAGDLLKSIPDFGFPNAYVPYRTGGTVGGGVQPFVAFQPLGNPFTGSESEGPASLAFTPPGFPLALQSGVFVGFHGRGGLKGLANEENPVVFVNLSTGQYYHFLSNDDPNIRHPDSLYAFGDSLFIADIGGPAGDGAIYQITYIAPEPGTIIGTGAALLALAAWRRRSL